MSNEQLLGWDLGDEQPSSLTPQSSRLVSFSQPASGVSVMDFLARARGRERFFWEDVRDGIVFAGFGTAVNLYAWGNGRFPSIQQQARALFADAVLLNQTNPLAAPRLFGGFAFRDDFVPENAWAAFQPAHFSLPHYQLVQVGGGAWLTINAFIPKEEEPAASLPVLQEALAARYAALAGERRSGGAGERFPWPSGPPAPQLNYPMSFETWVEKIETAVRPAHGAFAPLGGELLCPRLVHLVGFCRDARPHGNNEIRRP